MAQLETACRDREAPVQLPRAGILVVEDERIVARDLQYTLTDLGYEVTGTAASADDALREVASRVPDLVLMDIRLQGSLDGIELAAQLKARYELPVVYLTGNGDNLTVFRALTGEPDGYVLKPFDSRNLRNAIEVALRRDAQRRALRDANLALGREKQALEAQNRELAALAELGDVLGSCDSEQEIGSAVARLAGPLFDGAAGVLHIAGAGERSSALACWGGDLGADPIAAPLVLDGQQAGELRIRRAGCPRADVVALVAQRVGLALDGQRLKGRLRLESILDPLTRLYNRRHLAEALDRELRLALRSGRPVGVVMIDLDDFKQVNDRFGHDAGDAVLCCMAELLRARLRSSDIATRYGGDEMLLVLPDTGPAGARHLAEDILARLGALTLEHDGRTLPPVRASIGVAAFPSAGSDAASLLRAADAAVYRAKFDGRGCVRSAGEVASSLVDHPSEAQDRALHG